METEQEILKSLSCYHGSETFIKDSFNKCIITEGFKDFCDLCKCHWLFSDYAIQIMMTPKLRKEGFITLKIKVDDKKQAVVTLTDGNNNILHKKKYGYTDFPLKYYDFFIVANELNSYTFMLKGEY